MIKNKLVEQLFQWNKSQALQKISEIYEKEGFVIVSYVYGAVIVRNELLKRPSPQPSPNRGGSRKEALFGSSIILPDGAALLTWWKVACWLGRISWVSSLTNLNGTDFFVALLEYYLARWPVNLVCYGVYDEKLGTHKGDLLTKAGEWLQQHYGMSWTYAQDTSYSNDDMNDRDWEAMHAVCNPQYPTLMMVCRGVPRQEIWSYHHRDKLKQYAVIACNQWATIDYWAGRETRAPRLVRKLRLESIRRLVSDPRKNRSKFWVSFRMMWEIVKLFKETLNNHQSGSWA
jgi:exopolysaccharide biosynthesis WecB/TagA/CpsF family protein